MQSAHRRHDMPFRMLVTSGTVADCTQAWQLVEGIDADHLIADKGYDSDEIIDMVHNMNMDARGGSLF